MLTTITFHSEVRLSPIIYRDAQNLKPKLAANANDNNISLGSPIESRWKEGGDDDERGGIGISDCDNDLSLSVPLLNDVKKGPVVCVENGVQEYDFNIEKDYCCMRYSMC